MILFVNYSLFFQKYVQRTEGYVLDVCYTGMGEHPFNRYPREWSSLAAKGVACKTSEWSSYFNTQPIKVVNQELHWCLLILRHGEKSLQSIHNFSMGKCIAITSAKAVYVK